MWRECVALHGLFRTVDVRTIFRGRDIFQRTPANPHLVRRILLVNLKQFSLERFGHVISRHGLSRTIMHFDGALAFCSVQ